MLQQVGGTENKITGGTLRYGGVMVVRSTANGVVLGSRNEKAVGSITCMVNGAALEIFIINGKLTISGRMLATFDVP